MAVKEVSFEKGTVIIKKGDVGDAFYFIKSGIVRITDVGSGMSGSSELWTGLHHPLNQEYERRRIFSLNLLLTLENGPFFWMNPALPQWSLNQRKWFASDWSGKM